MKKSEYVNKILHLQNDFKFQYVWNESELNGLHMLELQSLYQSKLAQKYYSCLDLSQIFDNQNISDLHKSTIMFEPVLYALIKHSNIKTVKLFFDLDKARKFYASK